MQFLYFIPNATRDALTAGDIVKAGLDIVLRDVMSPPDLDGRGRLAIASVQSGPGGHNGVILQVVNDLSVNLVEEDQPPVQVGFYPQSHTWEPNGAHWVGHDPNALPLCEDLARDSMLDSTEVVLADGRTWLAPLVRRPEGRHSLPESWRMTNGAIETRVKPAWQWAWDLSGEIWDWWQSGTGLPKATAYAWCAQLLSINYRVGMFELGVLNAIGSQEYPAILQAAIGGMILDEYRRQKKVDAIPPTADSATSSAGHVV